MNTTVHLPARIPASRHEALRAAARARRPGLIADLDALDRRYAVTAAAAARHAVTVLCAVKASTAPEVLAAAAAHGLGFDVANGRELGHVPRDRPVPPLVSLTSPALPRSERADLYARFRAGEISRWHCDSLAQLADLVAACPGTDVGVRVNLDGLDVPAGMPLWRPSRFGIGLTDLAQAHRIAEAGRCRLAHVHTHNASEENDTAGFVFAVRAILAATRAAGFVPDSVDLGGGLIGEPTASWLDGFFGAVRAAAGPQVGLTVEPGRFWLTDCIDLVTEVLDVKRTPAAGYVVLDLGTMSHLQWSDHLRIPVLGPVGDTAGDDRVWRICGRSCFEEDWLEDVETVPVAADAPQPVAGDHVVLGNVSGYSAELACDFNGIDRPSITYVRPG